VPLDHGTATGDGNRLVYWGSAEMILQTGAVA
jgi:hypothetical protein